ncbi:hypothetical protein G7B40_024715 [Aetokthonos hydrillicola Thurmond2011]|jgi:predicted nucleic acid-binding protein|uniref:Uncharacterized protein n=1 Tax=Aetokthonos hydrillicola Thurmond2011 TaxID=2712845 RepID=A0AAP5ICK0_9CYAN|nr:hypothetical protein [Aetokthonos hydrillicola]MDR9897744.1 hypothetical protein [Aetokthonos hydrillicola Thurmond2011]
MPNTDKIVINTAPVISLIAALGDLNILESLYHQVLVQDRSLSGNTYIFVLVGLAHLNLKQLLGYKNGQLL